MENTICQRVLWEENVRFRGDVSVEISFSWNVYTEFFGFSAGWVSFLQPVSLGNIAQRTFLIHREKETCPRYVHPLSSLIHTSTISLSLSLSLRVRSVSLFVITRKAKRREASDSFFFLGKFRTKRRAKKILLRDVWHVCEELLRQRHLTSRSAGDTVSKLKRAEFRLLRLPIASESRLMCWGSCSHAPKGFWSSVCSFRRSESAVA